MNYIHTSMYPPPKEPTANLDLRLLAYRMKTGNFCCLSQKRKNSFHFLDSEVESN